MPERLFKYLPSKYVDHVVNRGALLFRNLRYFRQVEDLERGDYLEGHHIDKPDDGATIEQLDTGKKFHGQFTFRNTLDTDLVYVFCLSQSHEDVRYDDFGADACVEILDVPRFIQKSRAAVMGLVSSNKRVGLLDGPVVYYEPNKPAPFDIKDPLKIPFAKINAYAYQDEYRLVFGYSKGSFKLIQQILQEGFDWLTDASEKPGKSKEVRIGSIKNLVKIHTR